jgi:hypothetical protein
MSNDRIIINISNSPLNGLRRKVSITGLNWNVAMKTVFIDTEVEYVNQQGNSIVSNEPTTYIKSFVITNENKVNGDGQVSPQGTVGEYDFYIAALRSGVGFFTLLEQSLTVLDTNGRFN